MSPRRVGVLLTKELSHGSKSFIFFFAILVPIILSLVLSLVFGTLFSDKPKLGITDEGGSQMVSLLTALDAVITKVYASTSELQAAVRSGAVDLGIVLPPGFDSSVAGGQATEVTAYVWGQSLAKNRVILEATLADTARKLIGREVPLQIVRTTLGHAENVPWKDRLLPLIVLMAVVFGGSMLPATSLVDEKQKRTLVALTVTPATLEEVFLSKGLLGFIMGFLVGVLTLALNQALGGQPSLLVLLLALSSVLAAAFGVLLGTLTRDITSLFATIKAIGFFLYAPALVYLFPGIPEWVGRIFPTHYIVQPIVEVTQHGATWSDVTVDLLILIGLIVILIGVVAIVAGRTQQREV